VTRTRWAAFTFERRAFETAFVRRMYFRFGLFASFLTYLQHVRYPTHLRPVFNKIKQCRRVATRYDKLAASYLALIKLTAIRIWLRAYESTP
jgi:transposase